MFSLHTPKIITMWHDRGVANTKVDHIVMYKSARCIPWTYTMLYINYISIKRQWVTSVLEVISRFMYLLCSKRKKKTFQWILASFAEEWRAMSLDLGVCWNELMLGKTLLVEASFIPGYHSEIEWNVPLCLLTNLKAPNYLQMH